MKKPEFRTAVPEEGGRPCGLIISKVWKEADTQTKGGFLIKYELTMPSGVAIGIFHTPITSKLAGELIKYMQRNRRR